MSVFILPLLTFAEGNIGGIGGYPLKPLDSANSGWFMYNLEAGKSYDDIVVVKNNTEKEWIIDVYPADSIASSGGGFAVKQKAEEMSSLGSWVSLSKAELQLKPGEEEQVPFSISIPDNVNVGETAGAIMFEKREINPQEDENQGGIKLSLRTGVRIYNTVPGEIIQKLSMQDFQVEKKKKNDGSSFYLIQSKILNEGNVSTNARFVTTITDTISGKEIQKTENEFIVLRDTTFDNNLELIDYPLFANLEIKQQAYIIKKGAEEELIAEEQMSVWVLPLTHMLVVLIILIILLIAYIMHRKKYSSEGWSEYKVKSGDDLIKLAEKHGVDWKVFAKVNGIKPPYTLSKDQSIKIPPKK